MSVDWTPRQASKARVYGVCPICREPRVARLGWAQPPMLELVCPKGHDLFAPPPPAQDAKNPPRLH